MGRAAAVLALVTACGVAGAADGLRPVCLPDKERYPAGAEVRLVVGLVNEGPGPVVLRVDERSADQVLGSVVFPGDVKPEPLDDLRPGPGPLAPPRALELPAGRALLREVVLSARYRFAEPGRHLVRLPIDDVAPAAGGDVAPAEPWWVSTAIDIVADPPAEAGGIAVVDASRGAPVLRWTVVRPEAPPLPDTLLIDGQCRLRIETPDGGEHVRYWYPGGLHAATPWRAGTMTWTTGLGPRDLVPYGPLFEGPGRYRLVGTLRVFYRQEEDGSYRQARSATAYHADPEHPTAWTIRDPARRGRERYRVMEPPVRPTPGLWILMRDAVDIVIGDDPAP